jgi:hypothetical protein
MKRAMVVLLACLGAGWGAAPAQEDVLLKTLAVPAAAGWVDTGLDVEAGQELLFRASGRISLQAGNPEADCGPAGVDIRSMQQPVMDHNLGALVGKVAYVLGTRQDEETGEEIRDEIVRVFFIGAENACQMPLTGRLSLGVNENVLKDNSGEFSVSVWRRSSPALPSLVVRLTTNLAGGGSMRTHHRVPSLPRILESN